MAAATPPTFPSLNDRTPIHSGSRPTSIQLLHRSTNSRDRHSPASGTISNSNSGRRQKQREKQDWIYDGRGSMGRQERGYPIGGDSSDDDVPAPIKFSESVKALLGTDSSGVDSSLARGTAAGTDIANRSTPEGGRGSQKSRRHVRIASRVEHHHSTGSPAASNSLSSSRVVRVGSSNGRHSPRAQSAELSRAADKEDENDGEVREDNKKDFVTPASQRKGVRIVGVSSRSGTRSPSSASSSANGNYSRENRSGASNSQSMPGDDGLGTRATTQNLSRQRPGEEPVVHGSMRVKRVGKLSGAFLNEPARRRVPRPPSDGAQDEVSPAADPAPRNPDEAQDNLQPENHQEKSPSPQYRPFDSIRRSPREAVDDKRQFSIQSQTPPPQKLSPPNRHSNHIQKTASPIQSNVQSKSGLGPEKVGDPGIPSSQIKSEYKLPPLPYMSARKNNQENDAPPSINKSKSHDFDMLRKSDKGQQDDDVKEPPKSAASPRRPLGEINKNTPHRPAPPAPPPKMSVLETATASAGAATSSSSRKRRAQITINRKAFTRLDCIGRGGSSRVYRVMAENCQIFALKRVNLEDVDPLTLAGYKGEINLLNKLHKVDRVINLLDWELNDEKHALSMLMEMGESDLHRILTYRLNIEDATFDSVFARFYWKEMLECVKAIHDCDIVHSDLKPANFLLVKGRLKLIDFGIANAIQDHTVNIHRENQVGTPNYMAPEALVDCNAANGFPASEGKMMKLGKPSDVWSLGCILYQMVYGKPPFAHFTKQLERIMAIPNPKVPIEFRSTGVGGIPVPPGLIRTLKSCLQRDQRLRPSIDQLLSEHDPFLFPEASQQGAVPITEEMLGRILTNVVKHCRSRGVPRDEELAGWPAGFFAKLKAAEAGD